MNPELLETFLQIVEYRQISLAANALHITQAAVSNRLRRLESQVGVKLINRDKGQANVSLTKFGEELIPIAIQWMELTNKTNSLRELAQYDLLKIYATNDINALTANSVCLNLMADHPLARFAFTNTTAHQTYIAVLNGAADVGLSFDEEKHSSIKTKVVATDEFQLICGTNSIYSATTVLEELDRKKEIYIPWSNEYISWHSMCWDDRIPPMVQLDSALNCYPYLQQEQAWALVPKTVAVRLQVNHPDIKFITLNTRMPEINLYYIWNVENTINRKLIDNFFAQTRSELFKLRNTK